MKDQTPVTTPALEVVDGQVMATSLVVAEFFGKRHADVIRAVRNLECSDEFNQRNFASVKYKDGKGEERDMFRMTKNGFVFLVMGFTGKLAAEFKEAYILEFDRMKEELSNKSLPFWDKAALPPHDKFLEKMVTEAGKGNKYAKEILRLQYNVTLKPPAQVRCYECGAPVNVDG